MLVFIRSHSPQVANWTVPMFSDTRNFGQFTAGIHLTIIDKALHRDLYSQMISVTNTKLFRRECYLWFTYLFYSDFIYIYILDMNRRV